jgi:single-stranded DNA-binding protein
MHISQSLTQVVARLRDLVEERPNERRSMMSSTRVALNRIVIVGRAVTEPVTRNVKSHHGETTLTVFSIRTAKDTYVGSVIMEIHAWSRAAAQAGHISKGRTVAVDGQLTQHEYLDTDGRKQTRTAIRADRLQLIDDEEARE